MKKHITTLVLLLLIINIAYTQNTVVNYQYWFDGQLTSATQASVPTPGADITLNTDIDCSGIDNGLHSFHIRFGDSNNQWSSTQSSFIYKPSEIVIPSNHSIDMYEYWFDGDYTTKQSITVSPSTDFTLLEITPQGLEQGLHSFHFRFRDDTGQWSSIISNFFLFVSNIASPVNRSIDSYEYWFDGEYGNKQSVSVSPSSDFSLTEITPDELEDGLHSIHLRFKDDTGQWSSTTSSFFLFASNITSPVSHSIDSYEYWFDGEYSDKQSVSVSPSTDFALMEIILQGLENGLHSFHLRFKDNTGQWSSTISNFFLIDNAADVISENYISGFRYWFDGIFEAKKEINLAEPVLDFDLVSYLKPSGLEIGEHTFHLQFKDTKNQWGSILSTTFLVTDELQIQHYFSRTTGDWKDPTIWVDENGENLNSYPGKLNEVTIEGAEVSVSNNTESGDISLNSNDNAASRLNVQQNGSLTVHGSVKILKEDGKIYHGEIYVDPSGNIECVEPDGE